MDAWMDGWMHVRVDVRSYCKFILRACACVCVCESLYVYIQVCV